MLGVRDNLWLAVDAVRAHKLRAALTGLGLTMGVATLITVMTLVQGANLYVEQKIANLGANVFRLAKTPFARDDCPELIADARHVSQESVGYYRIRAPLKPLTVGELAALYAG